MIIKYKDFKKKYLIIWLAIFIGIVLISIAWIQIEKKKTLNINLAKYKYERELENSSCISPDGNAILKMVVVYDKPRGGEGYVLGFVHFKDTNEKRWIYLEKCTLHIFEKADVFNLYAEDEVYWTDNDTVVIGTRTIKIQDEDTYYFNKGKCEEVTITYRNE